MKVRLVLILGLALQAGAAFAAPVADPASATLALIPAGGERAPADAVMNRLEAAWLAQPGAALVERAQLDKILAEHQITGAALVDPAQRVRLGQLVPADLLVFLDSIPKLPKPATRLQVTESKTGIVLASGIFEDEVLLRDQAPALDLVRTAMGKQAVPAADRHLLGYLEFRSEESGPMLDGIAAALGTLVITDLARAPHIIVLEREHLQHLQTERDLTKLEQDLRASVRLLEGGVRRAPETNKLTITVLLRPLAGGESLTTALTVSRDDVSAARNLIGAAVARLLQARQPEQVTVDRATEAAVFARQAELWLAWNDRPRATQAAETAFALDSNQANRLLLAEILIHGEPQPGRVHVDSQTLALMRRRPSLSNAIRANELLLDYYRRQLELIASSVETNLTLPSFEWQARAPAAGDSPGIRRQQNELARLEDTAFRVQLDHYRQHYAQTRAAYWETWQHRLGQLARYRPDEPAKQIALVREAVQAFAQPPEPVDPIPYQRLDVLTGLPGQMTEIMTGPSSDQLVTIPALPRKIFQPLLRELTHHPDPYVRLVAWRGLESMLSRSQTPADEKDRIAAHFAGHQILIDELPPGHPYRNVQLRGSPRYFGEYLILCALMPGFYEEATPGPVIEKELEFHRHMIEALIANGESDRLLAWRSANNTLTGWLDQLAGRGHIAEALDLTTRLIAISKDRPQSGLVDRRTRFAQLLKIEPPATPVVATPRIEPAWEAYELQPIHFGFPFTAPAGGGRSVVFTVTDGNLLYSLRAAPQQPYYGANLELDPTLDCELTIHWLPSGELLERIGIAFGATAKPKLYAATLLHGILYVGTDLGLGAIDLQAKRWRLITRQNGLPGRSVRALGRFANRLYLGIGPDPLTGKGDDQSVFAVYDPPSAKFQIIASEKSVDTAIPWNGKRFLLDDIYPDESHGCLWLKDRQLGVWKFTPATSQFAPVLPAGKRVLLPGSRYVGQAPDIAHGTDSGWPVSFFIPEDQTQLDLPGGIDGIAIIHQSHQAVRDANFVLVSAHGLPFDRSPAGFFYLIKHGTGPAILRHTPDGKPFPSIIHLQPSSAGIVAVATNGDGFVIRRKAAAQTYRLAELQAASGNQQETKLLVAAADGRAAEVDQLLAAGTNINASDRRGWTALYHAINQQHPEIALQLLHRGAECQRSARGGSSPVSIAAEKNDVSVLKELLARHAPVESINTDGDTPLMLAAARGSVAAAELLLAVGADVNRRQPTGLHNTVLMIAIENGQLDAVKLLVLHGAAVESVNQLRNTPLILATIHGEVAILKFLREHGADVNADGQYAFTPLMHAANQSQLLAAQYLVEAGADVNRTQSDGTSALMVAAQFASPEMVQFLVDHGANVNATGQFGRTAMSWASYRNRLEIMNILRKAGAADLQEKKP